MSRFDLTFSGSVIEEFQVDQVKRSMGILLDLAEPTELDNLFIGRSYVLGQNLARKSAAEMFSKLTAMGAQVELVPRGKTPADAEVLHSAFGLAYTETNKPKDTSAAETNLTAQSAQMASSETLSTLRSHMRELEKELDTIKKNARCESGKLQHRIAYFRRIAERELNGVAEQQQRNGDDSVALVEELEESAMLCQERAEQAIAKLKEQEQKTTQNTKTEIDRLHGLIIETEDEEQSALEQLDQARAEIHERTDARVQELLAQVEELEAMAESEIATLERGAKDHLASWKLERYALADEQEEIQSQAKEQLEWLADQQHALIAESANEAARINQQRDDIRETRKNTQVALLSRQQEIEANLERNLARAERADAKAREASKIALQELHARKLELQRLATIAMRETGEHVSQSGSAKEERQHNSQ